MASPRSMHTPIASSSRTAIASIKTACVSRIEPARVVKRGRCIGWCLRWHRCKRPMQEGSSLPLWIPLWIPFPHGSPATDPATDLGTDLGTGMVVPWMTGVAHLDRFRQVHHSVQLWEAVHHAGLHVTDSDVGGDAARTRNTLHPHPAPPSTPHPHRTHLWQR